MTRFRLSLRAGLPIYGQVLYAARKAIAGGEFLPGDAFPSVRAIAQEHGINPNTVQKALNALKAEGLVEILPGIGARVKERPRPTAAQRAEALGADLEAVVLRAREMRLTLDDLQAAVTRHWTKLSPTESHEHTRS